MYNIIKYLHYNSIENYKRKANSSFYIGRGHTLIIFLLFVKVKLKVVKCLIACFEFSFIFGWDTKSETKWSIQKLESYQKTAGQSISCNKPRRATEAVGRRFHRDYPKRQMILVTELHWHRLLQNVFYWTSTKRWRRLKMKRCQYCSWNREEPVKRARLDPAPFCSRNLLSGCLRWRSCWSCARGLQPATGSICSHLHSDLAVHPLYNNPRFDFRSTPWILSDSSPNITTSKRYLGFHDSAQITRETEHIVEVNLLTERERGEERFTVRASVFSAGWMPLCVTRHSFDTSLSLSLSGTTTTHSRPL